MQSIKEDTTCGDGNKNEFGRILWLWETKPRDISQFLIFETKGQHLSGNQDTEYKKCVLETLEGAFNCGTMTLNDGPEKGTFRLVFNEHSFPPLQGEQK